MSGRQYWALPVPPMNFADGTANATTSLADISPAPQKSLYPGQLELGTVVRFRARGEYTCGSTATNVTIGFYYGGASANVPVASNVTTPTALTVSQTSAPWWMEYEGEIRALGAAGSVKGQGLLMISASQSADMPSLPIPQTSALRTTAIDTTTAKALTVAALVSQTVGAPSIICHGLTVELIG